MTTGVLLLAAGRGRRFGSDKRRASMADGRVLLDVTLENIELAGLPVLLCLGQRDGVLSEQYRARNVPLMLCTRSDEGMGATLAEGVSKGVADLPDWDACIVALADMPWVKPGTYRELAVHASSAGICVPAYAGQRGNPVCFGRGFYPALEECQGDQGARALLGKYPDRVSIIETGDTGVLRDVDQPGQLSQ